jgi:putative transposase
MKRSKFTDEQISYILRQVEGGTAVADVCCQVGISEATFYIRKKKYASGPWPVWRSAVKRRL